MSRAPTNRRAGLWALGLLLVSGLPAAAQEPAAATVQADSLLARFRPDQPGLSVLVARHGNVIYERALGAADLEHHTPITPSTRFLIGSVSKQFTAFAVLMLARDGKLSLDADIRTYLPELPDYGRPIRVSDLIHHTSGVRDQVELLVLSGTPIEGLVEQRAVLSILFRQRGLNFPPGSDFRYSNSNYTLLAEIVRRVAGTNLRRYLAERIFAPLGMGASFLSDSATEIVPARATGYAPTAGGTRRALLNYGVHGTTGVWTTPRDLLKWSSELLQPRVFDKALVDAAKAPGRLADGRPLTYAAALVVGPFAGRSAIYHAGADPGFQTVLVNFPAEDATVVVTSNGSEDVSGIAARLTDIFFGRVADQTVTPAVPDPARVAALAGRYASEWESVELEARDGTLFLARGSARVPLVFLPDGSFYVGSPGNRFSVGPDGSLLGRSGLSGTPTVLRRVGSWTPGREALRGLTGAYRGDEIDTTFDVVVEGEHLVLTSLRNEKVALFPADQDNFETRDFRYPPIRLTLRRASGGAVTGFDIATGRMKGLSFLRVHGVRGGR